jgi:rhamnosyltransferase
MKSHPSIGVAIITYRAKELLPKCLPPLLSSPLNPRVLVVNSTSNDGTVEKAQEMGAETLVIPRHRFNHGLTREEARHYLKTDIVVMITPDAILTNSSTLSHLVEPIIAAKASAAYARQIPHIGADFFESFPRKYNYPSQSHIRGLEDLSTYGVYAFFCSNACAAYSNAALDAIGGFQKVLLGEDTVAVAQLLREGHRIAYVAEAVVRHSHRYTLRQEFQRYFDIGLARREYAHLLSCENGDTRRGMGYFKEMTKCLWKDKPSLLPYAFAHALVKWLGYQAGRSSLKAPHWWKKTLSSQDFYWN